MCMTAADIHNLEHLRKINFIATDREGVLVLDCEPLIAFLLEFLNTFVHESVCLEEHAVVGEVGDFKVSIKLFDLVGGRLSNFKNWKAKKKGFRETLAIVIETWRSVDTIGVK